ncbi:PQQ-binding-like beta-propeller repeat protein [Rubritalea spongiae]|uniref:PQQ-binding-like beta-propeller repeat protein n=1 Tax=Rubritalea spongiae TaxID=430797 RepID=A0ABW5E2S3_9BACT
MKSSPSFLLITAISLAGIFCAPSDVYGQRPIAGAEGQWPMASGPNGTSVTKTEQAVPTEWSVSRDEKVLWRTELPEAGLSGIAVWGDKLFLTTNKPLPDNTKDGEAAGSDIVGYCLDAKSGEIVWSVTIPSARVRPFSSLFSDASTPTPVTDGKHVWFVNAGGMMACYDMDGQEVWKRPFDARSRHNAKQCQPILIGKQLLYVMMRDKEDPLARPMKARSGDRKSAPGDWPWTFVRSFDSLTGKPLWVEESGTSIHNTPRIGNVDGKPVVYHMRGGGHRPPEAPYGFSVSSVEGEHAGASLWAYDAKHPAVYTVSQLNDDYTFGIDQGNLLKFDIRNGGLLAKYPLFDKADIRLWDANMQKYELHQDKPFSVVTKKYKAEPTNHTPILVGKYFLFLTHEGHCIGRVDTESGKVEYLQAPIQVVRELGKDDLFLWDKHVPARAENARGIDTSSDKRSLGNGWGHVTSGAPIAVNQYVYFPTMIGMTYVVDATRPVFDTQALVSVNDLGPAEMTWSLSGLSYANGRFFHRGLKEIVCIGEE